MFKKMLLKLIFYFYDERLKDTLCTESFCEFVYNILVKKYSMKRAAESKYHHLLASCMKYKSIARVRVFGRLIGLFQGFDNRDLSFYMECLQFLQNSPSGVFSVPSDSLDSIQIPYVRCIECIKFFEKKLPKDQVNVIRSKLEKMKKEDKLNKLGVVDIDEFLEQLIEAYNDDNRVTKNYMECIYGASDLNNDGYLQYKEFELIMRFLSQIPFSEQVSRRVFEEYAETFLSEEDEEVKAISFENLCQINSTHKLFDFNSVKSITNTNDEKEAYKKLQDLETQMDDILAELYWRFTESSLWESHLEELGTLLKIIQEKIFTKKNPEMSYLAYCLLNLESKRIVTEERLKEFMPQFALSFKS
jgi:hypothetical protein